MMELRKVSTCIPISWEQLFPFQNQEGISCSEWVVNMPLQKSGGPFGNALFNRSDRQNSVTYISRSIDIKKNIQRTRVVVKAEKCLVVSSNYAGEYSRIDFLQSHTPYFLRKGVIKYMDDTRLFLTEPNDIVVNIGNVFEELYTQWCDRIKFDSFIGNSADIYHKKIVQLGYGAVPFIINKLKAEHAHMFIALNRITGKNPVKKENMGNVKKMTEDWIQWWEDRKYDLGRFHN